MLRGFPIYIHDHSIDIHTCDFYNFACCCDSNELAFVYSYIKGKNENMGISMWDLSKKDMQPFYVLHVRTCNLKDTNLCKRWITNVFL